MFAMKDPNLQFFIVWGMPKKKTWFNSGCNNLFIIMNGTQEAYI